MDSKIFEIQLKEAEVDYIKRTMPKGYSLMTTTKRRTRSRRASVSKTIPTRVSRRRTPQDDIEFAKRVKSGRGTPIRKRSQSLPRGKIWPEKSLRILQTLIKDKNADTFLYPVDKLYTNLPGYFDVIKKPMDLSKVKKKLKKNQYHSFKDFVVDVRLIWKNAQIYNDKESDVYEMAEQMSRSFEKMVRGVDKSLALKPKKSETIVLDEEPKRNDLGVVKKVFKEDKEMMKKEEECVFSKNQKLDLKKKIVSLSDAELLEVWKILLKYDKSMEEKTEVEIDISNLSNQALLELKAYVESKIKEKKRREMEKKMRVKKYFKKNLRLKRRR